MPIEVLPYDPEWPKRFSRIRDGLEDALRNVPIVAIEHVGSTSVPGVAAKPVIDVDVVVERRQLGSAIAALRAVGYVHRGDLGIADRHSLAAPGDGVRRNVYVVIDGSLALRNHLAVREALRANPERAGSYSDLKWRLAAESDDMDTYVQGKTELLITILADAGFTDEDLAAVRAANRMK